MTEHRTPGAFSRVGGRMLTKEATQVVMGRREFFGTSLMYRGGVCKIWYTYMHIMDMRSGAL